jgi:hypothetical protein
MVKRSPDKADDSSMMINPKRPLSQRETRAVL